MHTLFHLVEQYGITVVFANVLIEQLGAPIPAFPTLVVTGAMLDRGGHAAPLLLAASVTAALLADSMWYLIGRRSGGKVMAMLCSISLSPDSCVRQAESMYTRWGPASLLVAKFVPGFSTVASALAGTTGTRPATFVLFDALGAALWAGAAILLGSLFSAAVGDVLNVLEELGKWGVLSMVTLLAAFIAHKWCQRQRFLRSLRMARISVDELNRLVQQGIAPVVIDVRSVLLQQGGRIPGAVTVPHHTIDTFVPNIPTDQEVILYCACPNEASAAIVARQLMKKGYKRVRPLAGGIEAWIAAGYGVEQ